MKHSICIRNACDPFAQQSPYHSAHTTLIYLKKKELRNMFHYRQAVGSYDMSVCPDSWGISLLTIWLPTVRQLCVLSVCVWFLQFDDACCRGWESFGSQQFIHKKSASCCCRVLAGNLSSLNLGCWSWSQKFTTREGCDGIPIQSAVNTTGLVRVDMLMRQESCWCRGNFHLCMLYWVYSFKTQW